MIIRVLFLYLSAVLAGFVIGYQIHNLKAITKPVWVNQEIRERVFLSCTAAGGDDCGEQAKQIATVGKTSGDILFRSKEGVK